MAEVRQRVGGRSLEHGHIGFAVVERVGEGLDRVGVDRRSISLATVFLLHPAERGPAAGADRVVLREVSGRLVEPPMSSLGAARAASRSPSSQRHVLEPFSGRGEMSPRLPLDRGGEARPQPLHDGGRRAAWSTTGRAAPGRVTAGPRRRRARWPAADSAWTWISLSRS